MDQARRLLPPLASAAVLCAGAWAYRDYRAWRALGPGGLPGTVSGWLTMSRLRLQMRDPFDLAPLRTGGPEDIATLSALPQRPGPRPRISPHPIPHRQLADQAPADIKHLLGQAFDARVSAEPEDLIYARSHYEKTNQAIMLRKLGEAAPHACAAHGEVGHIHPSDGSMHMVLSPSDCRTVIEKHWGERHGLAGVVLDLPATYTMIYAPRDAQDLAGIALILKAAATYMTPRGESRATSD